MSRRLTALAMYLGLVPFVFADDLQKGDPKKLWLTDYARALEQARQSNKPLFVVFR